MKRGVLFFSPPYRSLGRTASPSDEITQTPVVPLGPGSVFSYLAAHAGLPCSFYYEPDHSVNMIKAVIRKQRPAVIGISCNSYNRFSCLMIACIAKKIDPLIQVVLGGVHATFLDEQILSHYPYVDYVIRGEGEVTLLELVRTLGNGGGFERIDGLSFRDGKRLVRNKPRSRTMSLDDFPLLDYEYFMSKGMKESAPGGFGVGGHGVKFPVETSRGCSFSCAFCTTVGLWGRKVAFRSIDKVIEQIRKIPRGKGNVLLFHDMNFTLDKDHVKAICHALKGNHIHMPWFCSTRVDLVDEDILRAMKAAGCAAIFFGVESLSSAILKRINKGYTPKEALECARMTAAMGIKPRLSFIIGFPGETEATLKESMAHCMKLASGAEAYVGPLMILPGSEMYAQAIREGFDESWWLKDHGKEVPFYEGALPLKVLNKWQRAFNSFRFTAPESRSV